jgi:hypothetical protein
MVDGLVIGHREVGVGVDMNVNGGDPQARCADSADSCFTLEGKETATCRAYIEAFAKRRQADDKSLLIANMPYRKHE